MKSSIFNNIKQWYPASKTAVLIYSTVDCLAEAEMKSERRGML